MSDQLDRSKELIENGKIKVATTILEKIVIENPAVIEAGYLLGICNFRQKKYGDAKKVFTALIAQDSGHINGHYYLGLSHERLGDEESAQREFKFTLTLKPSHKLALKKTGNPTAPTPQTAPPVGDQGDTKISTDPGELILWARRKPWTTMHLALLILSIIFVMGILRAGALDGTGISNIFLLLIPVGVFLDWIIRTLVTTYSIYERRIDIAAGYFSRKTQSIWSFEMEKVELERNLWLILTRTSRIVIHAKEEKHNITGIRNHKFMTKLWHEMRDAALVERRNMKKWWI